MERNNQFCTCLRWCVVWLRLEEREDGGLVTECDGCVEEHGIEKLIRQVVVYADRFMLGI